MRAEFKSEEGGSKFCEPMEIIKLAPLDDITPEVRERMLADLPCKDTIGLEFMRCHVEEAGKSFDGFVKRCVQHVEGCKVVYGYMAGEREVDAHLLRLVAAIRAKLARDLEKARKASSPEVAELEERMKWGTPSRRASCTRVDDRCDNEVFDIFLEYTVRATSYRERSVLSMFYETLHTAIFGKEPSKNLLKDRLRKAFTCNG